MYSRHKYNSDEEYRNSLDWHRDIARSIKENQSEYQKDRSEQTVESIHGDCDHPNTLENGSATVIYILVMIAGSIFYDRVLIWCLATFIWFNFITRHIK